MEIQENVPLAPLTTFQIGGNARYFIEVKNADDLGAALSYAETRKLPYFILAGGSNVLVADTGYDGVVIKMSFDRRDVDTKTQEVTAEAGCSLMETILDATKYGFIGMGGMYGIPGTVGGAVRGNAGAFGVEVVDVLKQVTALNVDTREIKTFENSDCGLGYRTSIFKKSKEWIILSATFKFKQGTPEEAGAEAEEVLGQRNTRQIQDIRSAGSFFMNPKVSNDIQEVFKEEKGSEAREGRVPAGWLIEKAGFKGACEGNVCTGERSANYVINKGGASATNVRVLTQNIQNTVRDKLDVELQEEITLIGF